MAGVVLARRVRRMLGVFRTVPARRGVRGVMACCPVGREFGRIVSDVARGGGARLVAVAVRRVAHVLVRRVNYALVLTAGHLRPPVSARTVTGMTGVTGVTGVSRTGLALVAHALVAHAPMLHTVLRFMVPVTTHVVTGMASVTHALMPRVIHAVVPMVGSGHGGRALLAHRIVCRVVGGCRAGAVGVRHGLRNGLVGALGGPRQQRHSGVQEACYLVLVGDVEPEAWLGNLSPQHVDGGGQVRPWCPEHQQEVSFGR
ncbi:hypothetical protein Sya03_60130 [Spirilliplanes yamanashiensis]|uniref:Uncharacterized protein n=1 Tax=Spirilliplanes yamanashiensis TaxID=42233 RepID=A0A8J3YDA0_9ACTN|nr:hypothetical protein Sya03_60130 [Spirilliplanes yamanashiensis]